jgi:hypothetical protein
MRRSVLTSVALLSAFLAGCEDGPNQTYSPAPNGAAGNWNNAGPDASYNDPGSQNYDSGGGGTNSVNVCTAPQQAVQWATAFNAPMLPPFGVGGIDLSAGGTFAPVTIEDVINGTGGQPQLCQGQAAGTCADGTGNPAYQWGPSGQLYACYDAANHQLSFFGMDFSGPGYNGTLTFSLPKTYGGTAVPLAVDNTTGMPADLNFIWQLDGSGITVNGQVLKGSGQMGTAPLWSASGIDTTVANQMYLGLMYTFQPTLISITNPNTNPPLNEMTDPNNNCLVTQKCRTSANPDGSAGNFGVRSVGIYFDAALSNSPNAATAATPTDAYMYPVKFEPYSLSAYNEGLDTFVGTNADPNLLYNGAPIYGPYAPAGVLSPAGSPATPFCTIYMGESFGDFTKACVNVTGNSKIDGTSMAKLLGAQHHTNEWFQFSVVGVNQNFSADTAELTQNGTLGVLQDSVTTPNSDDVATDFIVDVRASGAKLNDMRGDAYPANPVSNPACGNNNGISVGAVPNPCPSTCSANDCVLGFEDSVLAGQDLHGMAAVMGYYRALVIDALQALEPAGWAQKDPSSCWFDSSQYTTSASLNKALQAWLAPSGCTGFEQMLTPAFPQGGAKPPYTDSLDLGPVGLTTLLEDNGQDGPKSIFQPGDPVLTFVADPVAGVGLNNNITAPNLMQASLGQVTAIMGQGNVLNLPPDARDWRFYLQIWAQAYIGYLLNRSGNPTWQTLYNDHIAATHTLRQVNQDQLFFDLINGLDKFEYIDRTQAATLGAPIDFEYDILLNTSNTQDNNFYQRLSRAEAALYTTMLTANSSGSKKGLVPGSNENVNLSDLFGAPAIANGVPMAPAADASGNPVPGCPSCVGGFKDQWYCATTLPQDPDCPIGPPTDQNGNVLLDGEGRPLFTNYHGIWAGTPYTIGNTINVVQTEPFIASVILSLANYANPYDPSTANTPLTTIAPWIPSQPGSGFDIPINGQRTQFVQTGSMDFSGVTITTNIDYLPTYGDGGADDLQAATIAAVETQDFLGYVFPCVDAPTGDILEVKMYTSALTITNWLADHPNSQTACGIYVRYSPYDNYPDYITSTINGVLMSVNPGAGDGPSRIADATIFNPALLTQTQ